MSSTFGQNIKFSIFGQSHSEKIGVVIDTLPAGFSPDFERLSAFCARRTAVGKEGTTARKETDTPEIVSGLVDGHTCGAPLCALIANRDVRSSDYEELKVLPRPSHADYPASVKHGGFQDVRGGGHFSARLTAPFVFAGGLVMQLLEEKGVRIASRIRRVGTVEDRPLDPANVDGALLDELLQKPFPTIGDPAPFQEEIRKAQADCDSVGAVIECFVTGLPVGIGEPMFDSLESRISSLAFSIPAVKGIEFGAGFALCEMRGSVANDPYFIDETGSIKTKTNRNGGILGGLSTGMPLIFSVAFKPTPSIGLPQQTVNLKTKQEETLTVRGRHDPCVALRALPIVESAAALALCDFLL
ncbi:MAG: chorismate synthase [Clostridia bacterium]|nr:chorismate synthase [Clostridia bacterium]